MIKINLLGNETARDNTGTAIAAGFGASLALFVVVFFILHRSISSSIGELTTKQAQLQTELDRLLKITVEVKDLESKEKEFQEKLVVIARLKKNKTGPVRVLDDLNKAVPERSWLNGMKEAAGLLRIEGRALDNQTIAIFMKDLETSSFFHDVDLVETKQVEDKGVKIKEFVLNTMVSYAGLGPLKAEDEKKEGDVSAGSASSGAQPSPGAPVPPPAADQEAALKSNRSVS